MIPRIAAGLVAFSVLACGQQPQLVRLEVTVGQNGAVTPDVPQQAFTVFENGKPMPIQSVTRVDAPASICLVIDDSGSMRDHASAVNQTIAAFLDGMNPQSEVCVIHLGGRARLDLGLSQNSLEIRTGIQKAAFSGPSAVRDACLLAVNQLEMRGRNEKKAIVLISDGLDNSSGAQASVLKDRLVQSDLLFYALVPIDENQPRQLEIPAVAALDDFARTTGGMAYHVTDWRELPQNARWIAQEIRSQYSITYLSTAPQRQEKFRSVKVTVEISGKRSRGVRTRSGYDPAKTPN